MDFNFYEQYKNSSTVDLLLIVKQPEKYQPAAVDAANMILRERNVTEADEQQAVEAIAAQQPRTKKKDEDKTLSELLDPLTDPNAERPVEKAIYVLLTIVSILYMWIAYNDVKMLILAYAAEILDVFAVFLFLDLIFITTTLYLLWKRQPWGWRLLFGHMFLSAVSESVGMVALFLEYIDTIDWTFLYTKLLPLAAKLYLVRSMWQDRMARQFSIYRQNKRKVMKVLLIITGLFFLFWLIGQSDVKIIS